MTAHSVDPTDASNTDAIVGVAVCWSPYGGPPPSLIFERFGMTVNRYKSELAAALDRAASRNEVPPASLAEIPTYLRNSDTEDEAHWGI